MAAQRIKPDIALALLSGLSFVQAGAGRTVREGDSPDREARYRTLVEQIPAIVFMASLDRGTSEAYVSPLIEASLGFTAEEWLHNPIRWYEQIHPADKDRWSIEAAETIATGKPLRSVYRVLSRDGRVVWFQCEAKLVRHEDGQPWFIHGAAIDISELKQAEEALRDERNLVSAILQTVEALVAVVDSQGKIERCNRACERVTGWTAEDLKGKPAWEVFAPAEEFERFRAMIVAPRDSLRDDLESWCLSREGERRLIAWSSSPLQEEDRGSGDVIITGIDVTERKLLSDAVLEISEREQQRIGQDLHDGLGQHLTGIAYMSKALEQRLAHANSPEASQAAKISELTSQAISSTRDLARGLAPVTTESEGLASALQRMAAEMEDLFGIDCRFDGEQEVIILDPSAAKHLYRIAQESVSNAIRHGHAGNIVIGLSASGRRGRLTIQDDGSGFSGARGKRSGMGLQIMRYRAKIVGGSIEIKPAPGQGSVVICQFPLAAGQAC